MLVGEVMARMGLDSKNYVRELAQMETLSQKRAFSIGSMFKKVLGVAFAGGAALAIKDLISTAAKTEMMEVALYQVAKSSGYATNAIKDQQKAVMSLGIAEQEASQILMRFMQAQLDTADAARVARVAQDAAVLASQNSSDAAATITEAIAKQRPQLLSAYGMTRNLNDIYSDYAKSIGKTAKNLSEYQKKQAMVNYIIKEGEKIAGTYEAAMGTVGKKVGSVETLELSRKMMQEMKTALARPLMLPAFGVWVDSLHEGLLGIKNWVQANEVALKQWGQTAARAVQSVFNTFKSIGALFAQHWQALKTATMALIIYYSTIKITTAAVGLFRAVTLAVNGQLVVQGPLLGFVSRAMGIYRVQMALASASGIQLTGVLARLRVAIFAVYSALGPIGWAVLAITGVLTAGISLWNKYTQSLKGVASAGTSGFADFTRMQEQVGSSTGGAASALNDEADSIEKAGKAAKKSLAGFDELNQLSSAMSGAGDTGALEIPDIGGIDAGDLDGLGGGLFGIDEELPPLKERLLGFFGWLKEQAGLAWESLKQAGAGAWEAIKEKWDGMSPLAKTIATVIGVILIPAFALLGARALLAAGKVVLGWAMQAAAAVANAAIAVGQIALMIARWAWAGVQALIHAAKMAAAWVIALGPIGWITIAVIALAALILYYWDEIKEWTIKTWDAVVTWVVQSWETLLKKATEIWGNIKKFFSDTWASIKKLAEDTWKNLKKTVSDTWDSIQSKTKEKWDTIKTYLTDTWDDLKKTAGERWETIKTTITTKTEDTRKKLNEMWGQARIDAERLWGDIKNTAVRVWDGIKTAILSPIEAAKETLLNIIKDIQRAFANMKIEIPKPKLPHISVSSANTSIGGVSVPYPKFDVDWYAQGGIFDTPSIIGVGEAGSEVVAPLDKLTDIIAEAFGRQGSPAGDVHVYIGNEQISSYYRRTEDRRNIRSNGR